MALGGEPRVLQARCGTARGCAPPGPSTSDSSVTAGRCSLGEVLGAGGVGGDEGEVHLGVRGAGELVLGPLGRLLQPLERHPILTEVDALVPNRLASQSMIRWSKSSPPRKVSPLVLCDLEHPAIELASRGC